MKYKVLTPQEIETYKIGYAVGHRDLVITAIEWESEEEHKIYRKGYMAGLMDYKRNVSNVNNVSNVDIETSKTPISISISNSNSKYNNSRNNNYNNISTTRVNPSQDEVLEYARQQNEMAGVGGFACTQEQAQDFYDYYSGIGWHLPNDAQTPILDWKPFFRKWVRNPKHTESQKDPNDEAYEADLRFFARRKREREEEARKGGTK